MVMNGDEITMIRSEEISELDIFLKLMEKYDKTEHEKTTIPDPEKQKCQTTI